MRQHPDLVVDADAFPEADERSQISGSDDAALLVCIDCLGGFLMVRTVADHVRFVENDGL